MQIAESTWKVYRKYTYRYNQIICHAYDFKDIETLYCLILTFDGEQHKIANYVYGTGSNRDNKL